MTNFLILNDLVISSTNNNKRLANSKKIIKIVDVEELADRKKLADTEKLIVIYYK